MIAKIRRGIGKPGKLWTGSTPEDGEVVNVRIVERKCSSCDNTTRRLRTQPVEDAAAIAVACDIPTLFVTMGGVGSVNSLALIEGGDQVELADPYQLWNWSGRVGGHAILNPVAVLNGYWDRSELPKPNAAHYWACTYRGSTLSEYLLMNRETVHDLQVVKLSGKCPPCRHKEELEAIPEGLVVTREDFKVGGAIDGQFAQALRELELPEDSTGISARELIGRAQSQYCSDADACRAAVKAAGEASASKGTPAPVIAP
ncbi:MAG: hypothetical protein Q7R54_01180 [bacterium]|nr:hypothetical protein [bacterium]